MCSSDLGAARLLTLALTDRRRIRTLLGLIAAADEDPTVRDSLRGLVRMVRDRLGQLLEAVGLPHDPQTLALLHTVIVGAGVLHHARADDEAHAEAGRILETLTGLLAVAAPQRRRTRRERKGSTS